MASAAVVLAVGTDSAGRLLGDLAVEGDVRGLGERRCRVAGDRDDARADPQYRFEEADDFLRFAAVRNGEEYVVRLNDAEIAVRRLGGCRKNADVPVLASVAAIFRQMMPDLPMPVTMTRPWHSYSILTARSKLSSSRSTSARMAAASV